MLNDQTGIDERLLSEMASDLSDVRRNELDASDVDRMHESAMAIDPAKCANAPHGGRWCPRCGHCCTIKLIDGVWTCKGNCNAFGRHTDAA